MKNIKHIVLTLISLATVSSCSNFEELNTNTDKTTAVSSAALLTQHLKGHRFWNPNQTDYATAQLWAKHVVLAETNANPYQYYYSFWPYGSVSYVGWTNLDYMVQFSIGTPQESAYRAIALYSKASSAVGKTMSMGDVPYSEAGKALEGIVTPKYDKQADVIVAILADMKKAEELMATDVKFDGDFMYGGDPTKWRKLMNYSQLEVIQNISKKATAEQKARFAAIVQAGNLMTSNADNYQLVHFRDNNDNSNYPFYAASVDTKQETVVLSDIVVDLLKLYKDHRLFYFAEPAGAQIAAGKAENDFDAYVGALTCEKSLTLKLNNEKYMYSRLSKRYGMTKVGEPRLISSYAKQCFMIAEAIEEGWVTGDSKKYYEDGVKAALAWYKDLPGIPTQTLKGMAITQDYIDNYFTGAAAYASSKADRLKQIYGQRYLLDFFMANDSYYYTHFLRVGYPAFPLDPTTSMNPEDVNVYPKRWKYPTGELTSNGENYLKAIQDQYDGFDGINKTPWYLQ